MRSVLKILHLLLAQFFDEVVLLVLLQDILVESLADVSSGLLQSLHQSDRVSLYLSLVAVPEHVLNVLLRDQLEHDLEPSTIIIDSCGRVHDVLVQLLLLVGHHVHLFATELTSAHQF